MKKVLRKSRFVAGILILVVICLGIVLAGDVIVKEGTLKAENNVEGEKFKSTGCTATGTKAVAFGYETEASAPYSTAMGYNTTAGGEGLSTAMGYGTEATGIGSTAMGYVTTASGDYSTAMGWATDAIGDYSTAMGYDTTAGWQGTAMGYRTTASGNKSTAMGEDSTASGGTSTAMGHNTTASGDYSTATGMLTVASGDYSTAMGANTTAGPANYSTAIGRGFTNNAQDSFAVGFGQKYFSVASGLVHVYGKLTVDGDTDPKTLEFELQERDGVIERYEKYVTPGKKSGVVYINSETKQIEIYYPYEGVIRNILGETIYTLPSIRINNAYETYYVFDTLTGQIVEKQRAVYDKYRIKERIEFDSTTGQFIDRTSNEIIPKEEAIELYK